MAAVRTRALLTFTRVTRWFSPQRSICFRTVDRGIYLGNSAKTCSTLRPVECCHYTCSANTTHKYVPRRAVLYVPGNDERKLHKITSLRVDCAVLDCEDGVALNKKEEARLTIAKMLTQPHVGCTDLCVRINSVSSGLAELDMEVILESKALPPTLMLPKVETVEEIKWFADRFSKYTKGRTLKEPMNLITFVETAVGLLNFKAGCEEAQRLGAHAGFRLDGVVFGSDDFCASIGATRTKDARELVYARQKVVVTAKAFCLQAIDLVYIDYKDEEGLYMQSREGALMGFTDADQKIIEF
ncbi:citramalyl-CoA lyase, mitochondrial isoform X3 [Carcharodon carcharias]|uniref:citramalyl-CoA lyase, mitochondrial isoform X3 n=1 Tax=Carcharodon carcharias TaxID=13397 RepID=UPI001B7EC6D5|nr:citramalyl-CoA lyase, mitochondrial isoform X3 [Carcharodon carcharias]